MTLCAVDSKSECRSRGSQFKFQLSHITFVEIDHDIIFTVTLPITVIQEGQLQLLAKVCRQVED